MSLREIFIGNKTTNDYYLHHKRDCKICLTWFDSRSPNKLPKDLNKKEMKEKGTSNWWDNWVIERRSKSFLSADHLVASYILSNKFIAYFHVFDAFLINFILFYCTSWLILNFKKIDKNYLSTIKIFEIRLDIIRSIYYE